MTIVFLQNHSFKNIIIYSTQWMKLSRNIFNLSHFQIKMVYVKQTAYNSEKSFTVLWIHLEGPNFYNLKMLKITLNSINTSWICEIIPCHSEKENDHNELVYSSSWRDLKHDMSQWKTNGGKYFSRFTKNTVLRLYTNVEYYLFVFFSTGTSRHSRLVSVIKWPLLYNGCRRLLLVLSSVWWEAGNSHWSY